MERRTLALAALLAGWAAAGIAQDGTDATAIAGVIDGQLDAFNARDIPDAWSFASPGIQMLFGTPQNFAFMVQNGYPMVWTNGGAEFLDLREEGGRLWQRVRLRDGAGGLHVLDYAMIETPDGWRIDGVVILPAPEVGV